MVPVRARLWLTALVLALVAAPGQAGPDDQGVPVEKLNKKIDNFTLRDAAGKKMSLHDFDGKKAVVLVFLSFECHVSNSYAATLAEMAKAYGPLGVSFVGIHSSADADTGTVAKQAAEFKLSFPVLADPHLVAADAVKASVFPEAFILDHNFVLRYR